MNRRELLKGLTGLLIAASIPLLPQELLAASESDVLKFLNRVKMDIIEHMIHPPCIMHEDGKIEIMHNENLPIALEHVNKLIVEFTI